MSRKSAKEIIRELARRVAEKAASPENAAARERWRRTNDFEKTAPPVMCRLYGAVPWEIIEPPVATDPLERHIESALRVLNLKMELGDDEVFEPYLTLPIPAQFMDNGPLFGIAPQFDRPPEGGAWRYKRIIWTPEDAEKLRPPDHRIDCEATEKLRTRALELLDGILDIQIETVRLKWTSLGYYAASFLGSDGLLYALIDEPETVHALMGRLAECIRTYFLNAEREKLLRLNNGPMYCAQMYYTSSLPQPDFDGVHVRLRDLWVRSDGQDFGVVSPAMTEEFVFRYELPIMQLFGLVHFGCCEPHRGKWHLYRMIPNLRMLSVNPWTDMEEAVREMGAGIVYDWRVNVAKVVGGASQAEMRREIREGLAKARGCSLAIVLQDVETVYGNKQVLFDWVRIAKEEANSA